MFNGKNSERVTWSLFFSETWNVAVNIYVKMRNVLCLMLKICREYYMDIGDHFWGFFVSFAVLLYYPGSDFSSLLSSLHEIAEL